MPESGNVLIGKLGKSSGKDRLHAPIAPVKHGLWECTTYQLANIVRSLGRKRRYISDEN